MEWANYHFQCLNPFLTCRDWVALSWCCKFFYRECNLKKTLFRKFRKTVQPLIDSEHPQIREVIERDLSCFHGVISGGSMVSYFSGMPSDAYSDIDVYYFQWESGTRQGFDFSGIGGHIVTWHTDDTNYHHSSSNNFISQIHDISTEKNRWQFIRLNEKFQVGEDNDVGKDKNVVGKDKNAVGTENESKSTHSISNSSISNSSISNPSRSNPSRSNSSKPPILTPTDFILRVIDQTFDLEFCKIAFNGKFLYISNLPSMVYRKSHYKYKHLLNSWTKSNVNYHSFIENKVIKRGEKYKNRGYELTNFHELELFQLLIDSIRIFNKYKNEQQRRIAQLKQKQEQEQKEAELRQKKEKEKNENRLREEKRLALKWLTWDEDITSNTRESHLLIHNKCTPFSEWVVKHQIDYKCVYLVLAYSKNTIWIDQLFDKEFIPLEWFTLELKHFRLFLQSMYPTVRLDSEKIETEFWKYIYENWPKHIYFRTTSTDDPSKDVPHSGFY